MSHLALISIMGAILLGALLNHRNQPPEPDDGVGYLLVRLESSFPSAPDPLKLDRLRRAVRLAPSDPYPWSDLAEAYASSHQVANARLCLQTAAGLGSRVNPVLLRCAAIHARMGEYPAALPYLKSVLETDPSSYSSIFDFYRRHHLLNASNLDAGVPPLAGPAHTYFLYNIEHSDIVEATWHWLSSHSLVTDTIANEYVQFLLKHDRFVEARSIWTARFPLTADNAHNVLFDSDFESPPHDWIFNWTIAPCPRVEVSRDSTYAHSGRYSLRIHFDGRENVSFSHIAQTAVVSAGKYCLSAWVKSASLTTDQGVGFYVFDEGRERPYLFVPPVTGTSDWHLVRKCFIMPNGPQPVQVVVVRSVSNEADNLVAGTVWLDDVRLEPGALAVEE
jgi:hypothetical protein